MDQEAIERRIVKSFYEGAELKKRFVNSNASLIFEISSLIANAIKNGNKIMLFGNGGSASDAQHIASEFVNRFLIDRPPLPAMALTTDTSILTSIGNDYRFEEIFSRQIRAVGKEGDVAIAISTSGNSKNVIEAVKMAKSMKIKTVALTGKNGGLLAKIADYCLLVDSFETPRIQEIHITIGHVICDIVESILFTNL